MDEEKNRMKQIPNLFTLLNLAAGFMAIVYILQTGESLVSQSDDGAWIPQLPEKIWWGSACIGIAALIDFLDGFIARLFRATSAMGAQLDSLADVVSFGVAPGLIMYQLLRISYAQQPDGLDVPLWLLAPALLIPCAGAWRLARFNLSAQTTGSFEGVPIPAVGLFIASLPLVLFYNPLGVDPILLNRWTLYVLIIIVSVLMVSRARFMALKFAAGGQRMMLPWIILGVVAVVSALLLQWLAVPVVFASYILLSLIFKKQLK